MPLKIKNMKGIDLSCASPSSTAICSSMDQRSMIKNSTKSLNRLNTYLGDHYKTITSNINNNPYSPSRAPCMSELPFTPRPSSFSSYRDKTRKMSNEVKHSDVVTRRRSSADVIDRKRYHNSSHSYSSRYLLGESRYLDSLSESENTRCYNPARKSDTTTTNTTPVFGCEGRRSTSGVDTKRFGSMLDAEKERIRQHFSLIDVGDNDDDQRGVKLGIRQQKNARETNYDVQIQRQRSKGMEHSCRNDSLVKKPPSSTLSRDQVVVLRVSLHCKGCENKLRKHLLKMEGVTSYSIDMETKKVTVVGKVTPLGVLTSISRVKNAQFWPSQASSSSTSTSSSSSSSNSSTVDLN